jgi:pimeloyl-ACP methyl ester carboxylesterase
MVLFPHSPTNLSSLPHPTANPSTASLLPHQLLGGEGPIGASWLGVDTTVMVLAQRFQATVFQLEHRFYGETQPFASLSTSALKFLTSEQALADAAYFQSWATNAYSLGSRPWVVFGGSYSGTLAAWYRLKYPHLVVGAVATSAPVQSQVNFPEYLEVVTASLATAVNGPLCVANIRTAAAAVTSLMATAAGRTQLGSQFLTCAPVGAPGTPDAANFVSSLAGNFEEIVQYNRDNRAFEGGGGTTIDTLCALMSTKVRFPPWPPPAHPLPSRAIAPREGSFAAPSARCAVC